MATSGERNICHEMSNADQRNRNEKHGVKAFYRSRSVLITGVTGFLGGMILEKLLRGCSDVDKIYVLIRKKRGTNIDAHTRLKRLLSTDLFNCHSQESLAKVIAIPGDVSSFNLGLSENDRELLINDVSIVFHVAANINFSVQLSYMVEVNLLGTRRILQLCKSMKKIKAMVYVSTAFCNCTVRDTVAEKVYPTSCDVDDLIKKLQSSQPEDIVSKTTKIIGGHPNTYTFTKLLAENLILSERGSVAVAIVRPSMVLGTLKEPVVGWIDDVKTGNIALIAGAAKGVFRAIFAEPHLIADMVPADHVANITIAAAWSVSECPEGIRVFHITSGIANPITWGEYSKVTVASILKNPCSGAIWYPTVICQRMSPVRRIFHVWMFHYIQGVIVDILAKIRGDKPILLNIQKKYFKGMEHTKYFTSHEWKFDTTNTDNLQNALSLTEKEEFCFDVRSYNWPDFIDRCLEGVKKYYYKEKSGLQNSAKSEMKMLKAFYYISKLAFFIIVFTVFNFLIDGNSVMLSFYMSVMATVLFILI